MPFFLLFILGGDFPNLIISLIFILLYFHIFYGLSKDSSLCGMLGQGAVSSIGMGPSFFFFLREKDGTIPLSSQHPVQHVPCLRFLGSTGQ